MQNFKSAVFLIALSLIVVNKTRALSTQTLQKVEENPWTNSCNISRIEGVSMSKPDIRLSKDNIIEIFLPGKVAPVTACFPKNNSEYTQAAKISHIICRQQGYMTFGSRYRQTFPKDGIHQSLSWRVIRCFGHERSFSQCSWNNTIETLPCKTAIGIECTTCNRVIEASEGLVMNPGYPHAYLYDLHCEWSIVVPEEHHVDLTIQKFVLPQKNQFSCEESTAYLELLYGTQGSYTLLRYCSFDDLKNVSIPFREVRIRFSSGLYEKDRTYESSKKYGFSIAFKGKKTISNQILKILIATSALTIVALLAIVCYCCRKMKKIRQENEEASQPLTPNAPNREQIGKLLSWTFPKGKFQNHLPQKKESNSHVYSPLNFDSEFPQLPATAPHISKSKKFSIGTTPRNIAPNEYLENGWGLSRFNATLKTNLLSRFSTAISLKEPKGTYTVDPEAKKPNFQIYHSPSSEAMSDDVFDRSVKRQSVGHSASTPNIKNIPTIVIDLVDSDVSSDECTNS